MASKDELYVKINAKDSTATGINSAERNLNNLGNSAKKLMGIMGGMFAVDRLVSFGKESVKLYDIQAQAEQQLLTALKGRTDIQQRLIAQAQQLQGQTLYGDEETIRAQALIAAFVKEEEQIKRIIPLVQDMATAKQMDLAGAADLVSKTLGSSTNAMSRYGIEVNGAVGSVERLESLVSGLNEAFGGQAAAAATTGAGAIKQLENAVGDLKEEIGKLIVSGEGFSSFIDGSIKEVQDWATIISDESRSGFKNWVLFLAGSKKRWAEVAEEIRKTKEEQKDQSKTTQTGLSIDLDEITVVARKITTYQGLKKEIADQMALLEKADITDTEYIKTIYDTINALNKKKAAFESLANVQPRDTNTYTPIDTIKDMPDFSTKIPGLMSMDHIREGAEQAKAQLQAVYYEIQQEVDMLNQNLANSMAQGFAAGIEASFNGAGIKGILGAFLSPLGSFLVQEGTLLVAHGIAVEAFKESLISLQGVPAILAGSALIATGAAFKSFVGGGVKGTGGAYSNAYGGNGYSNYTPRANNNDQTITINGKLVADGNDMVWNAQKNEYTIQRTLG